MKDMIGLVVLFTFIFGAIFFAIGYTDKPYNDQIHACQAKGGFPVISADTSRWQFACIKPYALMD